MTQYNLSDLPASINIRNVHAKTVVNHEHMTMKNIILKSNEAIGTHQIHVDVTFFVLDGSGEIAIGDTVYPVRKDDIVLCPPNTPMSVQAGEDGLSFLNIKTPGI